MRRFQFDDFAMIAFAKAFETIIKNFTPFTIMLIRSPTQKYKIFLGCLTKGPLRLSNVIIWLSLVRQYFVNSDI